MAFGGCRIAPWSSIAVTVPTARRGAVDALLERYTPFDRQPLDPTVVWEATGPPLVEGIDIDGRLRLVEHIRLLAVAAIVENTYFSSRQDPVTAAHFEIAFHHLSDDPRRVLLHTRRRDGDKFRSLPVSRAPVISEPVAVLGRSRPCWNVALLDALASCLDEEDDPLTGHLRQSVAPFLEAAAMNPQGDPQQDLVWLGAALEQLLDVAGQRTSRRGIGATLADRIVAVTRLPVGEDELVRSWSREFYATRSAIHGRPAASAQWLPWCHALLATMVFAIALKQLLAESGRYRLSAKDAAETQRLPSRLRCLAMRGSSGAEAIRRCWSEATWIA